MIDIIISMEKKSIVTGIIGAIIGGIVGSLPWILVYLFTNMMFSYLGFFIGFGAFQGYKLAKGKTTKNLLMIVIIVSLVIAILNVTVVIPLLMMAKERMTVSFANLRYLYNDSEFKASVYKDMLVTVLFVCLGLYGFAIRIRSQIRAGKSIDEIESNATKLMANKQKEIRDYFVNNGSLGEDKAITIGFDSGFDNNVIDSMIKQGLLLSAGNNRYYYNLKKENDLNNFRTGQEKKYKRMAIIVPIVVFCIVALLCIISFIGRKGEKVISYETLRFDDYSCYAPVGYKQFATGESDDSFYLVPNNDLTGDSGYIAVYKYELNYDYVFEDELEASKEYFSTIEGLKDIKTTAYTTIHGYKTIRTLLTFDDYYDAIDEVFADNYLLDIEYVYYEEDSEIVEMGKFVTDSITLNN